MTQHHALASMLGGLAAVPFALALITCASEPEHPPWACNHDFVCDSDENQTSCPDDCLWTDATGTGPAAAVCDAQENWTFVAACLQTCGNGQEDPGETQATCPRDFPGFGCGDGLCAPAEDPARCPVDCHPGTCGDSVCDRHENAAVCPDDCTDLCGDGLCQAGEDTTCPRDCEPCEGAACVCGDGLCGPGESMLTCPDDCSEPTCGNGVQEDGEVCDDGNDDNTDACLDTCALATCGDGLLWAGEEECDDGPDNGPDKPCNELCEASACGDGQLGPGETCDDGNDIDTDACTNACQPATCGDDILWTGEEQCDDGNDVDTDACTNACQPATCGDNIVWTDEEECDDGNDIDTDACSNTCLKPRRILFVTSAGFKGNLGAIGGADMKCVAAATSAGLPNAASFKAWLSTLGTSPANRLDTQYQGAYVLIDGTPVAENGWADLTDGELLHPVDLTELNMQASSAPWTNTKADGTSAGDDHCDGWNNLTLDFSGAFGKTNATDGTWTNSGGVVPCSSASSLYCIEDP
ncbi:DUF4215 domain-containing protein [Nannocystis bainbridge]|uniref:DUF4215 domain-containing protein n=1 Tax=Nannocystis bainbridge TaxID=2995303 RepID=A0ABT5EBA2_9BACT|nr:DUF4215 domain-containing protein [Nannocystis bainbridge]MDC0723132.1 DUF4215 domain-containing protein [Nannocystis bainbridge]